MSRRLQPHRLPRGGVIDRGRLLDFRFNGRRLQGHPGDTLASALLACGVRVVGRSFRYHRPRGIFSAGEEEPNGLLEIGAGAAREPICRAPLVPLRDGLEARSLRAWPALRFDLGRVFDYTHGLWPAGFYNKTFMWPSWHVWEGLLRRAAGLGRPLIESDPDRYEQANAHCDLLVCGGGPAGLMAALAAGRAGLRVLLADQGECFGGSLNAEQARIGASSGADWVSRVVAELASLPGVMLLPRTTVTGCYDHKVCTLLQRGQDTAWRECHWTVRPRRVLLATGAIEQMLVFPDNDRPGIMLAGAVRHYLNRYAVLPGRRIVIASNNDSAYQLALDLAAQGVSTRAVIDSRPLVDPLLRRRVEELGAMVHAGARIAGTSGSFGLEQIRFSRLDGRPLGALDCDLLAVSGGWAPRVHLFCHARGTLRFDARLQAFLPDRSPEGFGVAGAADGAFALAEVLAGAQAAGMATCVALGRKAAAPPPVEAAESDIPVSGVAAQALQAGRGRQWIDYAHDVTFADAELAVREGFVLAEHFKRYTTAGMAVDQGKTGNLNALLALGQLTGRQPAEVGVTTFRPPYTPVTLGAIAGRLLGDAYQPRRFLPAHSLHRQLGAVFEDHGGWQRPACYPRDGESHERATCREVLSVRTAVGVFDSSPIGKLEVRGPDAARFLERVYVNRVQNLAVGRCRYGLMLNENGVIIDDGVFSRIGAEHFLLNTTSGGAARIGEMLEEWLQCEWPGLQVLVDDVTSAWGNLTLAGPHARELLQRLGTGIDLSSAALPHMACAAGTVHGLPARVARISFSGESSYEVNVPAAATEELLSAALRQGADLGAQPYGVEALMVLRCEKGYLHVGTDTDGNTIPDDVGWGEVARAKPGDFIGRRSLSRPGVTGPDRRQFVGLEPLDSGQPLRAGSHLLLGEDRRPPAATDGWITAACYSPTLGRQIALAMLRGGRAHMGETVTACDHETRTLARVVAPAFFDPRGERLRA